MSSFVPKYWLNWQILVAIFNEFRRQIKSNQIKYIFSNSNLTKLINYVKLQRDFTQKGKKENISDAP